MYLVYLHPLQPLVQLTVQERDITVMTPAQYDNLTKLFTGTSVSYVHHSSCSSSMIYTPFQVPSLLSREFRREDFRRVVFPGQSTALWTISPPSRDQLINQLDNIRNNSNVTIPLDFSWSIKRYCLLQMPEVSIHLS